MWERCGEVVGADEFFAAVAVGFTRSIRRTLASGAAFLNGFETARHHLLGRALSLLHGFCLLFESIDSGFELSNLSFELSNLSFELPVFSSEPHPVTPNTGVTSRAIAKEFFSHPQSYPLLLNNSVVNPCRLRTCRRPRCFAGSKWLRYWFPYS